MAGVLAAGNSLGFRAVWRAGIAVQAFPADVRVAASVAVVIVGALPVDLDDCLVEVDVLPAQPARLVLPEPEREPDRPPGAVTPTGGQPEQRAGLGDGQRFCFRFFVLRRVDQRAGITAYQFLTYGNVQGTGKNAVNLQDCIGGQSLFPQRCVELIQVLGI